MANTLGSLVVKLGLDAAEFTTGLTKSEYEAKKFAASIDRGIAVGVNLVTAALSALGLAAGTAFAVMNRKIEAVANFKQLSEVIGDTAENVAALEMASSTSGVALDSIAGYSVKLSAALSKIGEGQDKGAAVAALKAIGLSAEELKKASPVEQLEKIAVALSQFEDGAGKTAVAVALMGKSGAQALPFFNDLADAGGRQIKLTQEQIEEADRYVKAQARTRAEIDAFVQSVSVGMIPVVDAVKRALLETAKAFFGVDDASSKLTGQNRIQSWAKDAALALAFLVDAAQGVGRTFEWVGKNIATLFAIDKALQRGSLTGALEAFRAGREDIERSLNAPLFSQRLRAAMESGASNIAAKPPRRPLNFTIPDTAKTGGAEKLTDAERYLKNLEEQLARTEELTVLDKVLADIETGRLELSGNVTKELLVDLALEIDQRAALKKQLEEESQARVKAGQATLQAQNAAQKEVDSQRDSNNALRDEIEMMGASATKRAEIARARLDAAAAAKEEAMQVLISADGDKVLIGLYQQEINLLRERGMLVTQKGIAEQAAEDAKKAKEFVDSLGMAFSSAFEDAIVSGKGLREVLKGLEQDIIRIVTRKLVTEPLANSISQMLGTAGLGNLTGGSMGGFFGPLFGSGGAGVNKLDPFGFMGIPAFASGTNYAPGGFAKVGEYGPEIVNLPKGAQVIPINSAKIGGKSLSINQQINVLPGASRASSMQAAAAAAREARTAVVRNG